MSQTHHEIDLENGEAFCLIRAADGTEIEIKNLGRSKQTGAIKLGITAPRWLRVVRAELAPEPRDVTPPDIDVDFDPSAPGMFPFSID